jgi:DNA topoisomerase-3
LSDTYISYGPCQFPTLGFVVDRYWRIEKFVYQDFWEIKCSVSKQDNDGNPTIANFNWKRNRLFDHNACLAIYEIIMESPTATVIQVTSKPKRKFRPFPLTTVELQKLASKKLRISSEATMDVAEKLYQQGLISYPRTETDSFQAGTDFQALIRLQTQDNTWGAYATSLLEENKFFPPKAGKNNDNSHPPIHPTKSAPNLQGSEKAIYELVTRHFLACCSDDAQGHETVVEIDISGERFTTKGKSTRLLQ